MGTSISKFPHIQFRNIFGLARGSVMGFGEADTKAKFIDKMLLQRGWLEDDIRREETVKGGRVDYVLRLKISADTQPVPVALIEAKAEKFPPDKGLDQAKRYAKYLNVPFIYSSNGHLYLEFDRLKRIISKPQPLEKFPTPDELRIRYGYYEQVLKNINQIEFFTKHICLDTEFNLLNYLDKFCGESVNTVDTLSYSYEKLLVNYFHQNTPFVVEEALPTQFETIIYDAACGSSFLPEIYKKSMCSSLGDKVIGYPLENPIKTFAKLNLMLHSIDEANIHHVIINFSNFF